MTDENIMIKSFGFNQIHDNEMRKFECWGSVEVLDRHKEIIPAEEIYKIMDIWMDRGAPIQFMHTNRNVGKGLNWQKSEKNGKPGVLITGSIYKHYAEDDDLWEGIKSGKFEGLSIGGKSFQREKTKKGTYLRDLIGYEFSIVDRTGNQESTFTDVNMMAKSEEVKKEDPVMEENPNTELEDKISKLENMVTSLVEKISMIEEKLSGKPDEAKPAEEQKAETEPKEELIKPKEEIKKSDIKKEDSLKNEVSDLKKELSDLKKSMITKKIETKRPVEVKKEDKMSEVRKTLKAQAKNGKIDFKVLGSQMRG